MGDYSPQKLKEIQAELDGLEEEMAMVHNAYEAKMRTLRQERATYITILTQNCLSGNGKHDWEPMGPYDYVCRICEVLK